jgi:DNA primase
MPPLDYYFEVAKTTYDLKSARGKQQTLEKLAPLLLEISLPLPREHYLTKLSELTGISTTTIEAALSEISSNHPIKHPDKLGDQPRDDSNSILARMEDALMIDLLAYFPMSLTYPSSDGNVVKSSDFDHPDNSLIFEKLAILAAEWLPIEALGEALALASDSLSLRYSYLQLLAAQTPEIDDPNEAAELIQYKLDKLRKGNFQKTYNSLVEHLEGIEQKAEVEDSDLEEIVEVASMANNIRDLILQYS